MQMLISGLFIGLGIFFIIVSTIGIFRFNSDKLAKVHAIGITDAIGVPLIAIGVLIQNFNIILAPKMILLIFILWITSATSGYIATRIVYRDH